MAITFNTDGVYKATIIGEMFGATAIQNVFQLKLVDGGPLGEADGLADIEQWLTEIFDYLATITSTEMVYTTFRVDALEGTQTSGTVPLTAPIAGVTTGHPLPTANAMLSYFPTGERRRQLRKYWGGWDESANNEFGVFTPAIATGVTTNIGPLMLLPYVATHGTWLYGHYRTGEPDSFIGATSMITTNNPVVQRRRRGGRGI